MNEKDILKRMDGYEYGRFNLIDNNFSISESYDNFKIKNFYSGPSKRGVCNELSSKFVSENPDLDLIKIIGTEPDYFNDKNSVHVYLISPGDDLPKDYNLLLEKEKVKALKNSNSLIVDPSYHKVVPIKGSGYFIHETFDDYIFRPDEDFFKYEEMARPLGFTKSGELLSLGLPNGSFGIFMSKKKSKRSEFCGRLDTFSKMNFLKREKDLGKIVKNLGRAFINRDID